MLILWATGFVNGIIVFNVIDKTCLGKSIRSKNMNDTYDNLHRYIKVTPNGNGRGQRTERQFFESLCSDRPLKLPVW